MESVLEQARTLAEAIQGHARFQALRQAEKAVEDDAAAKELLTRYNDVTMTILRKEQEMKPVEPDEKRTYQDLKEKVAANPLLQALNKAQADYSDLMNNVNKALFEKLGG